MNVPDPAARGSSIGSCTFADRSSLSCSRATATRSSWHCCSRPSSSRSLHRRKRGDASSEMPYSPGPWSSRTGRPRHGARSSSRASWCPASRSSSSSWASSRARRPGRRGLPLGVALTAGVAFLIARDLFDRGKVDAQTVLGALSLYVLVGVFFASLYSLVAAAGTAPSSPMATTARPVSTSTSAS